jgi:MtN3 and saliva related transmembrane protein
MEEGWSDRHQPSADKEKSDQAGRCDRIGQGRQKPHIALIMWTDLIGWSAAAILLLTIGRQVFSEWRDRSTRGLSKWLFVGQLAASIGFVIYSWLLGNWVFMATNLLMLATAGIGQWIYLRNKRREERAALPI